MSPRITDCRYLSWNRSIDAIFNYFKARSRMTYLYSLLLCLVLKDKISLIALCIFILTFNVNFFHCEFKILRINYLPLFDYLIVLDIELYFYQFSDESRNECNLL